MLAHESICLSGEYGEAKMESWFSRLIYGVTLRYLSDIMVAALSSFTFRHSERGYGIFSSWLLWLFESIMFDIVIKN